MSSVLSPLRMSRDEESRPCVLGSSRSTQPRTRRCVLSAFEVASAWLRPRRQPSPLPLFNHVRPPEYNLPMRHAPRVAYCVYSGPPAPAELQWHTRPCHARTACATRIVARACTTPPRHSHARPCYRPYSSSRLGDFDEARPLRGPPKRCCAPRPSAAPRAALDGRCLLDASRCCFSAASAACLAARSASLLADASSRRCAAPSCRRTRPRSGGAACLRAGGCSALLSSPRP